MNLIDMKRALILMALAAGTLLSTQAFGQTHRNYNKQNRNYQQGKKQWQGNQRYHNFYTDRHWNYGSSYKPRSYSKNRDGRIQNGPWHNRNQYGLGHNTFYGNRNYRNSKYYGNNHHYNHGSHKPMKRYGDWNKRTYQKR